jgi:hypothetical protein
MKIRLLIDANPNHGYNVIEISSHPEFGFLFKKKIMPIKDTVIRVNDGVFGECLTHDYRRRMTEENITEAVDLINNKYEELKMKTRFLLSHQETTYKGEVLQVLRVTIETLKEVSDDTTV